MVNNNLSSTLVISAMLFLIILTRISHELTSFALPDASLIIVFAAGLLFRDIKYLITLVIGIIFLDNFAIYSNGYNELSLFNISYVMHLAVYPMSWWFAQKLKLFDLLNFSTIILVVIFLSFSISYGSYFYLYDNPTNALGLLSYLLNNFTSYFLINGCYAALLYIILKLNAKLSPLTTETITSK